MSIGLRTGTHIHPPANHSSHLSTKPLVQPPNHTQPCGAVIDKSVEYLLPVSGEYRPISLLARSFARTASLLAGPGGLVLALEPIPEIFQVTEWLCPLKLCELRHRSTAVGSHFILCSVSCRRWSSTSSSMRTGRANGGSQLHRSYRCR